MAIKDDVFNSFNLPQAIKSNKSRFARFHNTLDSSAIPFFNSADEITTIKPNTNLTQTEHKAITNLTQTKHKPNTNLTQTEHKPALTKHKPNTQPNTQPNTNLLQTRHKPNTNRGISSLVGNEKKMLYFIYNQCKHSASLATDILTFEFITYTSKINKNSVKTTLRRLMQKNFIYQIDYKDGRGGWVNFEIEESIYKQLMHEETRHKPDTNLTQSRHKPDTQPDTQPDTMDTSSSSKDLLNTTTTEIPPNPTLPIEWEEIDLRELQKRGVSFSKSHLTNLWEFLKGYSAFEFQESIDGYVYDIDHNHVQARRGYLNLLIGAIRNGQLYVSSHYVSPERKKINEMIALGKQRKAELESYHHVLEEAKFLAWIEDFGAATIKKQLPLSLAVDFEHKGKASLEWIKQHLYPKLVKEVEESKLLKS